MDLARLPADITLNTFIRDYAGLPGTKFMCQEGGCGVCVCTVTNKDPVSGEIRTRAVNSVRPDFVHAFTANSLGSDIFTLLVFNFAKLVHGLGGNDQRRSGK